jgi:glyoxylase-like metal-dependent hydrolase (beta-lactamase superfamily II)
MPRPEYLYSLALQYAPGDLGADMHRPFYRRHGLSPEITELVLSRGHEYLRRTTGVPTTYHRIRDGDELRIGDRRLQVLTGGGHALEQAMLVCPEEKLFFAADQVIARISPNVSVHAMEPDLDALGIYLASLRAIREAVPADVLVLPGHGLPFFGLHTRIGELIEHHAQRCGMIAKACRERALSVADLLPFVFDRALDEHQTSFAFGEVLAHVNHMLGLGELVAETDPEGRDRYRAQQATE